MKRWIVYLAPRVLGVVTVAISVALLGWVIGQQDERQTWAAISGFSAAWIDGMVEVQFDVHPSIGCLAVTVEKSMIPIIDNSLITVRSIPLNGNLPALLRAAPVGRTTPITDRAKPRYIVVPGHYQITVHTWCETEDGAQIPAWPSAARIVVPEMP